MAKKKAVKAVKKTMKPKRKSPTYGGTFEVCGNVDTGVKIHNIRVSVIKIAGHNSSEAKLGAYYGVPANTIGDGPHNAVEDGAGNWKEGSEIVIANCTAGAVVDISLVIHHKFTPIGAGIEQSLCEIITLQFDCDRIRPCTTTLKKKIARKK